MKRLGAQFGLIALLIISRRAAADVGAVDKMPGFEVSHRTTEPLLKSDKPWEDYCVGYCQVMHIGTDWHMWYDAYDHNYKNDSDGHLCYARSRDGITWEKPKLGLVNHQGST